MDARELTITIEATGGPGRTCGAWDQVEVGVQVGKAWEQVVPGDVGRLVACVQVTRVDTTAGPRWRGPAAHGPTGDRFLYLVWTGVPAGGGEREMFRRAKLKFATIPPAVLTQALAAGVLRATLSLRGPDGTPTCGSPKDIAWSVP
ncbi:MAG: DUF5990 family protein [Myxococcota bacterium]